MIKQKQLQALQNEKLKESKYDEIILQQQQVIMKLQKTMEKVVQKSMDNEMNQDKYDRLEREVYDLQKKVNSAQYGFNFKNDQVESAEYQEMERLYYQSIPTLRSILNDLQSQIASHKGIFKPDTIDPNKDVYVSKKQLMFNEQFMRPEENDDMSMMSGLTLGQGVDSIDLIESKLVGNWREQKQ